jgi:DnaJ-class molecular chaperone
MSGAQSSRGASARVSRTLSVSNVTEALLGHLSARTGMPRGRIVDYLVGRACVCPTCAGSGVERTGGDMVKCPTCYGHGLSPGGTGE